jgi:hypothetical protein
MDGDPTPDAEASSPFDPYIREALTVIATGGDVTSVGLSQFCATHLGWLPGFSDVILSILRTNGLIVVNEWEPGKVHITRRGHRWIDSPIPAN